MFTTARIADGNTGTDWDSRVLWRAILRFDDVELADQLFWLVAHERMAPHHIAAAKRALTPTILEACAQSWSFLLAFIPLGIAAVLVVDLLFFSSIAAYFYYAIIFVLWLYPFIFFIIFCCAKRLVRHSAAKVSISENSTWEQCLAQHPHLLRRLRRDSHLDAMLAPSDQELATAIKRALDNRQRLADPRYCEATDSSGLRLEKFAELTKMVGCFPGHVPNSAIPDWVALLGDFDWKNRLNARLVVRAVGIDALPALWRARRQVKARRLKPLIRAVIRDNQSRIAAPGLFVCIECFSRFQIFQFTWDTEPHLEANNSFGGPPNYRYSACRVCKSARHARNTSKVVCVVGNSAAFDSSHFATTTASGDRLFVERSGPDDAPSSLLDRGIHNPTSPPGDVAVPWSTARRPFDFDMVHVGLAEDWEIERFAAAVEADDDRFRRRYRQRERVAVRIESPDRLSANSHNILRRLFPHAFKAAEGIGYQLQR